MHPSFLSVEERELPSHQVQTRTACGRSTCPENSSETRQTETISEMAQKLAEKGAQFAKKNAPPVLQLG